MSLITAVLTGLALISTTLVKASPKAFLNYSELWICDNHEITIRSYQDNLSYTSRKKHSSNIDLRIENGEVHIGDFVVYMFKNNDYTYQLFSYGGSYLNVYKGDKHLQEFSCDILAKW